MTKKRRPIWTAVLSLIIPGLGHVYAGDLKKGLSLIGVEYGVIIIVGLSGVLSTFFGIASIIVFAIGLYVFAVISSVRLALNNKEYKLQAYNRWYWYLAVFVSVGFIGNLLLSYRGDILGYETYRIIAKSMEPTLQVGDFITVDTKYQQPQVGDVIVFRYPRNRDIPYVKRVAAVGNDTISINDGIVYLNGAPENLLLVPESRRLNDFSISMDERKIPEHNLFVLGDWRDNSNDSRFWGTVPITDVIGKVTYIWYSNSTDRIGKAVK